MIFQAKKNGNMHKFLFLIIILVGISLVGIADAKYVPEWIKNTAGWWSNDQISEQEFMNAIEFLIQNEVIKITQESNYTKDYSDFDEIVNDETLSTTEKFVITDKIYPKISGYRGAAFDGESVYYAPYYNNYGRSGTMIKYNIGMPFNDTKSWEVHEVGKYNFKGFQGALYNNNYVYYVPYYFDETKDPGSKLLRYNTELEFNNKNAWQVLFYLEAYEDGVIANDFVYFSPHLDYENKRNANPLRYDSTKPFTESSSWERYESGLKISYIGASFDGRFVYYAPFESEYENITIILRYDTTKDFLQNDAWKQIEIPYGQYSGTGFNGKNIVMAPYCFIEKNGNKECSKILFLESKTQEISYSDEIFGAYNGVIEANDVLYFVPHNDLDSKRSDFLRITDVIETFSPSIAIGGYWGGVFDGRFVYYAPYDFPETDIRNGEFLRFDTTLAFNDDASWEIMRLYVTDFDYNFEFDDVKIEEFEKFR